MKNFNAPIALIGTVVGMAMALMSFDAGANQLITESQIIRAEQMTTYFENGVTTFAYDYFEHLKDGRGFTAGRVGFCTGTGDLIQVVASYCNKVSTAHICIYQPALERINTQFLTTHDPVDDRSGLRGFKEAWKEAARDGRFRTSQDEIAHKLYLYPTFKVMHQLHLQTPIALAILYDTFVMHGDETGGLSQGDGVTALIGEANKNRDRESMSELEWLKIFLDTRMADMMSPKNPKTQKEWRQNVWRLEVLRQVLDNNPNLDQPIVFDEHQHTN